MLYLLKLSFNRGTEPVSQVCVVSCTTMNIIKAMIHLAPGLCTLCNTRRRRSPSVSRPHVTWYDYHWWHLTTDRLDRRANGNPSVHLNTKAEFSKLKSERQEKSNRRSQASHIVPPNLQIAKYH